MTEERGPLSERQFDAVASWDERQKQAWGGLTPDTPHEQMPLHEARKYVDPVFSPWEKFKDTERGYIGGLAQHVKARGVQVPVIISEGKIFDGHHRLAAAEDAGLEHVPVVFKDRRGSFTDKMPPHRFPLR